MTMPSTTQLISSYVGRKASFLQELYTQRNSAALGQLAAMRQAGITAGDDPRAWNLLFDGMPPELLGRGIEPSYAEQAIQAAFYLFAHHQQSMTEPMHRKGVPFGMAVGMLAKARSDDGGLHETTLQRFQGAAMAQTHAARVKLLRQLTAMMRAQKSPTIGLDYGALAADLFRLQFPSQAPQVRLAWGRQLHRLPTTPTSPDTTTTQEN